MLFPCRFLRLYAAYPLKKKKEEEEEVMKKLCSVTQNVEELGFFKKSQLGRKKMLEKNTEEERSSGKRGLVPADPELERQGVGLLLFCAVIKTCQNSRRMNA